MNTITYADIITNARSLADQESTDFVTDAEALVWCNVYLRELYDRMILAYEDYYNSVWEWATVNGTEKYLVPEDLYKLRQVFYLDSNGGRIACDKFAVRELEKYRVYTAYRVGAPGDLKHRLLGRYLWLAPTPREIVNMEVWYIKDFVSGKNTADIITFDLPIQWEDYVTVMVAARMMIKEESDPSALMALGAQILNRLIDAAENRDTSEPDTITDVDYVDEQPYFTTLYSRWY